MADLYRIFVAEMSPYWVKVRSHFGYKAIPHQWILRNVASQAKSSGWLQALRALDQAHPPSSG